jgi:hypothetical protein
VTVVTDVLPTVVVAPLVFHVRLPPPSRLVAGALADLYPLPRDGVHMAMVTVDEMVPFRLLQVMLEAANAGPAGPPTATAAGIAMVAASAATVSKRRISSPRSLGRIRCAHT